MLKPICVSPKTSAEMQEAIKMLCGAIDGYPDIHGYPDVKACYSKAHALLDQVEAEHWQMTSATSSPGRFSNIRRWLFHWWYRWHESRQFWTLGPHIDKALHDQFVYALGTRCGAVFYFQECTLHGKWLLLSSDVYVNRAVPVNYKLSKGQNPQPLMRGVQVRLSDVVWFADSPYDS